MNSETYVAFGDALKTTKNGDQGLVEATGVRFTGPDDRDLDGEFFTASTDYGPHAGNGMAATLNHRQPMITSGTKSEDVPVLQQYAKRIFPNPVKTEMTPTGIIARHILNLADEYEAMIFEMAQKNKLRWSSGAPGHMVDKDETKQITTWHIAEWAYTPIAADPNLPTISPVKSLENILLSTVATVADDIAVVREPTEADEKSTQEDAGPASVVLTEADGGETTKHVNDDSDTGDVIMSEEKQVAEQQPAADNSTELDAILKAVQTVGVQLDETKQANADQVKAMADRIEALENAPAHVPPTQTEAPTVIKTMGDNEHNAFAAWYRTGDVGGVKSLVTGDNQITVKASNATDMNIGTDADGGYAVPTGHYQGIIARMHEDSLYQRLGVTQIPGIGTTVNVPIDNEADGEFVATNEASTFDLDAPALGTVAMTLVKYTKNIKLSYELLEDEDSRILSFVENWVGQGLARTHNNLMLTEALADGTAGLTLDGAAAITAAEIPELMYKLKGEYTSNAAWVVARATEGLLRGLTGDNFMFVPTPQGSQNRMATGRELFGAPVYNSQYMPAATTGLKSMIFGNFSYMGVRIAPEITFLRNPYLLANAGQISLHYYTRIDYEVLQAEAIQYATQA